MKNILLFFVVTGFVSWLPCQPQTPSHSISIHIPGIEQEASSIWRTIKDIEFLEKQGYDISLPKNELIDTLVLKSKNGTFGNDDYQAIYQMLSSGGYDENDYRIAVEKVSNEEQLINEIIQQISISKEDWDWEFKLYTEYNIVFTLYGSGGSYDPNTGTVTLFTNKMGEFKKYDNPANTIVHEITHLGMESSIVMKYNLPHRLKERIVDKFVYLMFQEQLPDYKVQNMEDFDIDNYLETKNGFKQLDRIIKQYSF